ncbi:MAG: pyrroline-5-carboxylate reductase [Oscillospiraceae bacterium]|nr:pyrroline-5-carboxylate reductase [Oscillospiraceae bacterium]
MRIGAIGFGNLASALLSGMLKSGNFTADQLGVYDISAERMTLAQEQYKISTYSTAEALVRASDVVILSVKPQFYKDALSEIKDAAGGKLFISVAAGISTRYITDILGDSNIHVIRSMPNTALLIGQGATAISKGANVADDEMSLAESIFGSCGVVKTIEEAQMNDIIAVNGSSPAYIFLFAKAVCSFAEKHGIDPDTAKELIAQTLLGSAVMIRESGMELSSLISMVTSKGGTTERALGVFNDNGFSELIEAAMQACSDRADELGK